jgi:hypothetical protein
VTGNIDKPEFKIVELEVGKAEIDGDAATFFFRKSVRIGAGKRADEGALSVVYVPCGAYDY